MSGHGALPIREVLDVQVHAAARRSIAVLGHGDRGALADHVPTETQPGAPLQLQAQPAGLCQGGLERSAQRGRLQHDQARTDPAGMGHQAARADSSTRTCSRAGRSTTSRPTQRPESSDPARPRPSMTSAGRMTSSQRRSTPRPTASTGSKARARSSQATMSPAACASATQRSASVVLPLEGPPRTTTLASRGRPAGPRMASRSGNPVEMTSAGPSEPACGASEPESGNGRQGEGAADGRVRPPRAAGEPAARPSPRRTTALPSGSGGWRGRP